VPASRSKSRGSMDPKDVLCRSVVRDQGFDDKAASVFGSVQAADEALIGLEFAAARHPEHGRIAGEHNGVIVYALKTHPSAIAPAAVVYYTIGADAVTFLQVELAEYGDMDV